MIEMLKDQYPRETEALDTMERSARHAAEMVRHLLSFARGTEGRRVSVQPLLLMHELEKIVKGIFPKNIHLELRMPRELPAVLGDATQLHQVLLNLCVNARDAMPDGGTLTLEAGLDRKVIFPGGSELQDDGEPAQYVVLRVTDSGTGIAPEFLDRIFDPFFTTKGPEMGTGLGLFTAAGIVKGHGGFIRVDSKPLHGSTFAVYLPAAKQAQRVPVSGHCAQEFRGSGETILYVDDEGTVRDAARAVLSRLNFKPLIASDGMGGLSQAVQQRAELRAVITDAHMPNMDGLAFVRALRRSFPELPVVLASGRLDSSLAQEFRRIGVQVILDKPFTQASLAEALRIALSRTEPETAVVEPLVAQTG
jgi:two-component system, cell cycle sensor histidine kinase and response regulator CckA